MKICLDAGHHKYTSGKRCMKEIDPAETREWILNSRVAEKLQRILASYDCETMRVDDVTGERDVTLSMRAEAANQAGADVYVSIHHNAGIQGGSGGGIVVFTEKNGIQRSKEVQKAVYEQLIQTTGLRGNRSRPLAEENFYVLVHTEMPAVLCELGFMDSTTDTPIILTDAYAEKAAQGLANGLIEVYGLRPIHPDQEEGIDVTEEKLRQIVREELEKRELEQANEPADEWAVPFIKEAAEAGLLVENQGEHIDRPKASATRQELATMGVAVLKAVEKRS